MILSLGRSPFRKASVDDGNEMFMDLLEKMNTELDALREDFNRAIKTTCKLLTLPDV